MHEPPVQFADSTFTITPQNAKISKRAKLYGSQELQVGTSSIIHDDVIIRADLGSIKIGNYNFIGPRTVIRPSMKLLKDQLYQTEALFGHHVIIEENCIVSAVKVGSSVYISKRAIVGKNCVIHDCVYVMSDAVLVPETICPPFSIYGGNPAKIVGQLPVNFAETMKKLAMKATNSDPEQK